MPVPYLFYAHSTIIKTLVTKNNFASPLQIIFPPPQLSSPIMYYMNILLLVDFALSKLCHVINNFKKIYSYRYNGHPFILCIYITVTNIKKIVLKINFIHEIWHLFAWNHSLIKGSVNIN